MTIATTTHLNFRGTARAALQFYAGVFGGQLTAISYRDANAVQHPEDADRLMWGQLVSAAGFRIMAYDVPAHLPHAPGDNAFFVSVRGADQAEIADCWSRLAEGATILMPLGAAAWSPLYGMLKDSFGIIWVLDVEVPYAP